MITSNWKKVKLGEVLELQNGYAFKSSEFTKSGTPVIKIKNMSSGSVFFDTYWQGDIAKLYKYTLSKGDIIVSMTGSHLSQRASAVGKVTKYNSEVKGLLNQRVGKLIPNSDLVDKNFIYYLLTRSETQEYWGERAGGAANQANISPDIIKSMEVYLPDLDSQKSVGEIVLSYDLLIENNEKRIKILEESAQRLYEEWIANYKFPGSDKVVPVKSESEFGEIPKGWELKKLDELANFINGYAFKPKDLGLQGFPIIKIPELRSGTTDSTPRNNGENIPKRYHIKTGDLLFSWSATLLVNFWKEGSALLNQHLFNIVPKKEHYRELLFFLLRQMIRDLSEHVVGSTMKHLRREVILNYKVIVPSDKTLKEFSDIQKTYFDEIEALDRKKRQLSNMRDLLVENLITGKRELNDTTR